jgi:hypothetical protein
VSEWWLLNMKWAIVQLYHCQFITSELNGSTRHTNNLWPYLTRWQLLFNFFAKIVARRSYILIRWWCCPLCTRSYSFWIFIVLPHRNKSAGSHIAPLKTSYSDSEPASLWSYFNVRHAVEKQDIQFYSIWFDTQGHTNDVSYILELTRYIKCTLKQRFGYTL